MKKYIKLIFLVVFSFMIVFWIGSQNFYLGSANYSKTAFEELGSEWVSGDSKTYAKVIENDAMDEYAFCMILNLNNEQYVLKARGHKQLEVYKYKELSMREHFEEPKVFRVKYKKRWGKVYAFTICDINKSNLLLNGNDSITLIKKMGEHKGRLYCPLNTK